MASALHNSPRPVPVIVTDSPFSQRKRTPFRASRPPKAPAKSCPPVSRVFNTPTDNGGPKLVSFKSERKTGELVLFQLNHKLISNEWDEYKDMTLSNCHAYYAKFGSSGDQQ